MAKYRKMHWTYGKGGIQKPKMAFDTLDEALRFARNNCPDCQPYVCDVCGAWHLGHYRKD